MKEISLDFIFNPRLRLEETLVFSIALISCIVFYGIIYGPANIPGLIDWINKSEPLRTFFMILIAGWFFFSIAKGLAGPSYLVWTNSKPSSRLKTEIVYASGLVLVLAALGTLTSFQSIQKGAGIADYIIAIFQVVFVIKVLLLFSNLKHWNGEEAYVHSEIDRRMIIVLFIVSTISILVGHLLFTPMWTLNLAIAIWIMQIFYFHIEEAVKRI